MDCSRPATLPRIAGCTGPGCPGYIAVIRAGLAVPAHTKTRTLRVWPKCVIRYLRRASSPASRVSGGLCLERQGGALFGLLGVELVTVEFLGELFVQ